MAKFCGKCGSRLNEATGLCPNCDAEKIKNLVEKPADQSKEIDKNPEESQLNAAPMSRKEARAKRKADKKAGKKGRKAQKKAEKKAKKKEKWEKLSIGQKIRRIFLKFFAAVLALLIVVGCAVGSLVYFEIADIPVVYDIVDWIVKRQDSQDDAKRTEDEIEEYMVETIDADNYFAENSSIISSVEVSSSNKAKSEAEAYNLLTSLGFSVYEITTEYSLDGMYYSATSIDKTSDEKHPMYQTYYLSEKGEIWTITLIGDVIMAYPVSYNIQTTNGVSVMFSETESIMSYDSATNRFFETIPNESVLIVKVVEIINSETLENLTIEVIESYE